MSDPHVPSIEAEFTSPPRWQWHQSVDRVFELNELCLELISGVAAEDAGSASACVSGNRDLWVGLTREARRRAARFPFAILDLHFADEVWWRSAIDARASAARELDRPNGVSPEPFEGRMQEILMFAWHMAQLDTLGTQALFGMRPPVIEMIAVLTPTQVRDIGSRKSREVRIRWSDDIDFWHDLLVAAEAGDDELLADLHLDAMLLLYGPISDI